MKRITRMTLAVLFAVVMVGCTPEAEGNPVSSAISDVTSSDIGSEIESEEPISSEVSSEEASSSEVSSEAEYNYWENLDNIPFEPDDGNSIWLIPETDRQFFWYETYEIPVEFIIFGDMFDTRYGLRIDSLPDGVEYVGEDLDKVYNDQDVVSYKFVSDKPVPDGQSKTEPVVEVIKCSVIPVEGTNENARSGHPTLHVIHSEYGVFVAKNGEDEVILSYFDWLYKNGHMTWQEYDAAIDPFVTMTPIS